MKFTIEKDKMMSVAWAMVAVYAAALIPMDAFAQGAGEGNKISDVLCSAVEMITGPIGSALATLAIIVIGVGALMGKVSWGMAIIVGIGVGVIFGAPTIVSQISGSSFQDCATGGGGW